MNVVYGRFTGKRSRGLGVRNRPGCCYNDAFIPGCGVPPRPFACEVRVIEPLCPSAAKRTPRDGDAKPRRKRMSRPVTAALDFGHQQLPAPDRHTGSRWISRRRVVFAYRAPRRWSLPHRPSRRGRHEPHRVGAHGLRREDRAAAGGKGARGRHPGLPRRRERRRLHRADRAKRLGCASPSSHRRRKRGYPSPAA